MATIFFCFRNVGQFLPREKYLQFEQNLASCNCHPKNSGVLSDCCISLGFAEFSRVSEFLGISAFKW